MSRSAVVVTSQIGRASFGNYMRYLTCAKPGQDPSVPRVLAYSSDLGDVEQTIAAVEAYMEGTARVNSGVSVIHSFKGLDPKNPQHVKLAMSLSRELMEAGAPDQPIVQVAQGDGKGGKLHVHNIAVNHNLLTGKAARGAVMHWQWWAENDRLMDRYADLGFERVQPGTAKQSAAERIAAARGAAPTSADELGVTPVESLPRAEVTAWIGAQIDELVADGSLDHLPSLGAPARTTVPLDAERSLSVWVKAPGKAGRPTITYAVVDADGAVVAGPPSKAGRRPLLQRTQTQLDKQLTPTDQPHRYDYAAITDRITQQQQEALHVHDTGADRSGPQPSPRTEVTEAVTDPAQHAADGLAAGPGTRDTPDAAEPAQRPGGMLDRLADRLGVDRSGGAGGPDAERGRDRPAADHGDHAEPGGRTGRGDRGVRDGAPEPLTPAAYDKWAAMGDHLCADLDPLSTRKTGRKRADGHDESFLDVVHERAEKRAAKEGLSPAAAFDRALDDTRLQSGKSMREFAREKAGPAAGRNTLPGETMLSRRDRLAHTIRAAQREWSQAAASKSRTRDRGMSM